MARGFLPSSPFIRRELSDEPATEARSPFSHLSPPITIYPFPPPKFQDTILVSISLSETKPYLLGTKAPVSIFISAHQTRAKASSGPIFDPLAFGEEVSTERSWHTGDFQPVRFLSCDKDELHRWDTQERFYPPAKELYKPISYQFRKYLVGIDPEKKDVAYDQRLCDLGGAGERIRLVLANKICGVPRRGEMVYRMEFCGGGS